MKKLMLLLFCLFIFLNCADKKEVDPEVIALGEKLFAEKTCVACHAVNTRIVGPSIVEIVKHYSENKADLELFLKGKTKAIVDTDPGQIAIMEASLKGILINLPEEQIEAIAAYMKKVAIE